MDLTTRFYDVRSRHDSVRDTGHLEEIYAVEVSPDLIRKAIYTTNAIESLNRSLGKVTKNRGSFPNDESALKLLYLALRNISKKWTMPIRKWEQALNQFAILFSGRLKEN